MLNKRKLFCLFFILCSSLLLSSCVSTLFSGANAAYNHRQIQHTASDYYTAFDIQGALDQDPILGRDVHISVTSFNQIVLLVGQVKNTTQRIRAAKIAQNAGTPAIRIYNGIIIGEPTSTWQTTRDTWITTKIKARLIASNDIDPDKIKVITENGTVFLMGIVPKDQADIAVDIARNTAGVNRVIKIFYYVIMPQIK